jgi:hypothetical protein
VARSGGWHARTAAAGRYGPLRRPYRDIWGAIEAAGEPCQLPAAFRLSRGEAFVTAPRQEAGRQTTRAGPASSAARWHSVYRARMPPRKLRSASLYAVTIDVPRAGGQRAWNHDRAQFEARLETERLPVLGAQVELKTRRGADKVRIRLAVTVEAADIGQAVTLAWAAFARAAGDARAWDMTAATAEARPAT